MSAPGYAACRCTLLEWFQLPPDERVSYCGPCDTGRKGGFDWPWAPGDDATPPSNRPVTPSPTGPDPFQPGVIIPRAHRRAINPLWGDPFASAAGYDPAPAPAATAPTDCGCGCKGAGTCAPVTPHKKAGLALLLLLLL